MFKVLKRAFLLPCRRFFSSSTRPQPFRLQIASDLHLEEYPSAIAAIRPSAPHLALLGDIGAVGEDRPHGFPLYRDFLYHCADQFKTVFVVAGNHEYYTTLDDRIRPSKIEERIRETCAKRCNLIWLQRASRSVAPGLRILGATLWSHIPLWAQHEVEDSLRDYRCIYKADAASMWDHVTPRETNQWHAGDVKYIHDQLEEATNAKQRCIVLTHHAPLIRGVSKPEFETIDTVTGLRQPVHTAFASPLDHLLAFPSLRQGAWAFGHTHFAVDTTVFGDCRLVSNPRGYGGEHCAYRADCVIEV